MKTAKWLLWFSLIALLAGGLILACGGDDDDDNDNDDATDDDAADDDAAADDDDDCTSTVEEVCDFVFATCEDHWGWPDSATCYEQFMAGCADESAYFSCVCQCYTAGDCDTFSDCEFACWDAACD